ncbi:hypothetical protein B0T10DRAFT_474975 [Thelonectria olida]|uniref:Uncharacterized protein n=1 Tax=Thelonectria olida TaxID=1576542 RepID=A0A9P9ARG6_9HYPO|nr:hypothetical protein B0T10DRAFT_474975 [Thelonectria olida]
MKFSTLSALALALVAPAMGDMTAIVKEIAPNSENCVAGGECRTAEQAAPYIESALKKYQITQPQVQAAVIALMAFESGSFTYKHNISPGRPGQGTANMQMATYNLMYANSFPEVKEKVTQAGYTTVDSMTDAQLNELLGWVSVDKYNFGSGPWYLTTQCPASIREALVANIDTGFTTYMQECVGVEVTEDRAAYLTAAKEAFGLA